MADWPEEKRISVVVDTPGWFDDHAAHLVELLNQDGHDAAFIRRHQDVREGDIAFYLACMRITPLETLSRNKWNLVVHESDLPEGRGFAPMTWAVLEGRDTIPVSMIIADDGEVDSGPIVLQRVLKLTGYELSPELRQMQAEITKTMCREIASQKFAPEPIPQTGTPSFLPRRRPEDSELDMNKTLLEQFNLLRVVDNERYPAFFFFNGRKYIVKIFKESEA